MKKQFLITGLLILFMAACSNKGKDISGAMTEAPMEAAIALEEKDKSLEESHTESADQSKTETARDAIKMASKLIYRGELNMEVRRYREARNQLNSVVKAHGGYISSERESMSDYRIENTISIRVPSAAFDSTLAGLSGLASIVESKNVSVSDVTAEYIDVAARLKTKKEVEARYIDLLSKAQRVSDIIEVEEQLRQIREEIESSEGQLKYWDDQVSWSTIDVYMYENKPGMAPTHGFIYKVKEGFRDGWSGLLSILVGMVTVWPLWLFFILMFFIIRFLLKRYVFKKK